MYIDIHTYKYTNQKEILSLVNLNVPDHFCCCGLDLENTNYSLGIHPWKISEQLLSENLRYIEENAAFECVKAIGECGLDNLSETPGELQMRAFLAQITISEKLKKPMIIHCVKAYEELIAIRKEIQAGQAWIIHGFRGKPEQMQQLTRLGFYLSFGKYFNEETIRQMPFDKLFLETDDKEIDINQIYKNIAQAIGVEEDLLIEKIASNYKTVFSQE